MRLSVRLSVMFLLSMASAAASAQHAGNYGNEDGTQAEFHAMGFGDISYVSKDGSNEDGFVVGQAVAHLVASLGNKFNVFGEFSMTARDTEYTPEVERLIVRYDFSDRYKLSAGRYHTPIGYWNSAFHHGAWLQTTAARPEMVKFGSQIAPIHFVGVLLEGTLPSARLGLNYKAGYGNGRHANIARSGDAGDVNGNRAWMLQLGARPHRIRNLDVGIGMYTDEIELPAAPSVAERTYSAYAAWTQESPEIIVEYLHSEHEQTTDSSISGGVDAWYAQVGWRLTGNYSKWKPYGRLEHTDVDASDPVLGNRGLDYDAGIIGARWDFNPYAALKAEYRNEEFANGGRENNFRLQVSFVLTRL